jgi:hypothetical protein
LLRRKAGKAEQKKPEMKGLPNRRACRPWWFGQKRCFGIVGRIYFVSKPAGIGLARLGSEDYSPSPRDFIRGNITREINSSQNSIQSRQYCLPLGGRKAAAANAARLKG